MLAKFLLLSAWIALFASFTPAQENSGKLKIRIVNSNYPELWKHVTLRNEDTVIHFKLPDFSTQATFDQIPFGRYSMESYSKFGDKIVSPVYITGGVSKLKVNINRYYKEDLADVPFIDRLAEKDTLKILSQVNGCFADYSTYYGIIKPDSLFAVFWNDDNGQHYKQLSETALINLRELEETGRKFPKSKRYSTTTCDYYFCLQTDIIHFKVNGPDYIGELFPAD